MKKTVPPLALQKSRIYNHKLWKTITGMKIEELPFLRPWNVVIILETLSTARLNLSKKIRVNLW